MVQKADLLTGASEAHSRYAEKARMLLDLLGRDKLEALERKGLGSNLVGVAEQANLTPTQAKGETGLMERFRRSGLIEETESATASEAPVLLLKPSDRVGTRTQPEEPKQQNPRPVHRGMPEVGALIASSLDRDSLSQEHPAIIAHVLRNQPLPLQAEVLQSLPGRNARAVIRLMRAN